MDRIPLKTNPKMFDRVVEPIQIALANAFPWLDHSIGICETLIKKNTDKPFTNTNHRITPNLYIGNGQYEQIEPCEELGNFSFFYLRDPQTFGAVDRNIVKSPFTLIVWYNLPEVLPEGDERNREEIKGQITGVLHRLHIAGLEITRIYERPENVFSDFSYEPTTNQYLMHPFAGLRIDGFMTARADCFTFPNEGVGNGSFSDESFDTSSDI